MDEDNGKALVKGNGWYRKVRRFSSNEFWKNVGCLISDPIFGLGGSSLWDKEENMNISENNKKRRSIRIKVHLYEVVISEIIYCPLFIYDYTNILFLSCHISVISLTRGKEFRKYWPKGFELEEEKSIDEWWRETFLIYGFNAVCKNIFSSYLRVGYESMSTISFCIMAKVNLPHLSYIIRKP